MIEFVTNLFSNFWVSLTGKLLLVALMIPAMCVCVWCALHIALPIVGAFT